MKKVGIITFHFADNFGAVLQVYALLRTLQGKNIHVEIINYIPQQLREFYNIFFDLKKSVISLGLVKTIKKLLVSVKTLHTKTIKIKNFEKFRNEHLSFSEYLYTTSEELLKKPPIYDVYVTGSDQIWNPDFFTKIGGSYFLDFAVKNADKVSYAASIAKPIESRYFEYYKNYLQSFNYISVRENTAKNELKNIINKDVYIVLDPTLLLEKEDWEKIATYDTVIGEKYILVYDLVKNQTIIDVANKLVRKFGYKIISYSNKKGYHNWHSSFANYNPTDFIGLYSKSEFVLTSSFHGTAFALIFNKPFYTLPHPTRGNRMIELLEMIGLNDRLIYRLEELKNINANVNFDYANKKLSKLKKESMNYIEESLGI